jgi:signal transduction histidine kinase
MEEQDSGRKRLLVELNESGSNRVLIGIEDSGPGVPDAKREEIFDPFFTTKDDGSGLGLATSHRIVTEHNGELKLEDGRKLSGARFEISLPKGHKT